MTQFSIASSFNQLNNIERKEILNTLISTFINGASDSDIKELATDMSNDHRTLVQQKFGLFLKFAEVLAQANTTGHYDARNEYAVKTAAKILEVTDGMSGVPFI